MQASALVFCALFTAISALSADGPKPALAVSWHSLSLPAIEAEETKPNEVSALGVVEFERNGGKIRYRLSGMRIEGNLLRFDQALIEVSYAEIKGKNVLITDIPEVTVTTVRREKTVFGQVIAYEEPVVETKIRKERKETLLFTMTKPGFIVEKKVGVSIDLTLPTNIKVELARGERAANEIRLSERQEIIVHLQQAIDEQLSDTALSGLLEYRLTNAPKEIEPFLRNLIENGKSQILSGFRTALKQEIEKPEFLNGVQEALAKTIPPLALDTQNLIGHLHLSDHLGVASNLILGEAATVQSTSSRFDSQSTSLRVAANSSGLTLAMRSYFKGIALNGELTRRLRLGAGFEVSPNSESVKYTPTDDSEREVLAALIGCIFGEGIDARDLSAVVLDLGGKQQKPEIRLFAEGKENGLSVSVGITVHSRRENVEPLRFGVILTFKADASGALILQKVGVAGKTAIKPTPSILTQTLDAMKLQMIQLLLNQDLKALQSAGSTKQKFAAEILNPDEGRSEPVIVLQIK